MKQRAAERPQSLNIATNSSSVVAGDAVTGTRTATVTPGARIHADKLALSGDILEQSLRAADVLADYSNAASLSLQPRTAASLPLAYTATSSISAGVAHPLVSGAVDCALDYSQQQQPRVNKRRHTDNNDNNNNNSVVAVRHSLCDIVTPTSDVTTASSPSETLSQVSSTFISLPVCLSVCLSVFWLYWLLW